MGTYNIPRNLRGETRILVIFTLKSLASTSVGIGIGLIFLFIFSMLKMRTVGIVIMVILALIGFVIGRFNVPTVAQIPITKKIGGIPLGEAILRYFKFKSHKKIYVYTKEEK